MIIDNHRENSGASNEVGNSSTTTTSGGAVGSKFKHDLIRIIQERRMSGSVPKSASTTIYTHHHNRSPHHPHHPHNPLHHHHHHQHRRLSNSTSPNESLSSSYHNHNHHHSHSPAPHLHHQHPHTGSSDSKSWGAISALFSSSSLDKKSIKSWKINSRNFIIYLYIAYFILSLKYTIIIFFLYYLLYYI